MSLLAQSGLETTLRHEPLAALPVLFAAGLATSLTPCVYPLISVTHAFFGGQSDGNRRFLLAVV